MSSYPKGEKNTLTRRSRPHKRKFYGSRRSENDEAEQSSASARKLPTSISDDIHYDNMHCYKFIEFFTVFTALSELVVCRECKQAVKFEEAGNRGLGFKIVLLCRCGRRDINSGPFINNGFEINRRIVLVMRLLGVAREGINLFCNFMDMCDGLSETAYNKIVMHLHTATQSVFQSCSKKAVEEEKIENEKNGRSATNLKVSGDGSWKKRGFKSLYGVTTLIGYYSGKVVDLVVKSSFCAGCNSWKNRQGTEEYNAWYEEHEPECQENHQGSAGGMEVESIKEMFLRSEKLYGVKYGNYIGDGDSKTFKGILDVNPYGDDFPVVKSECIGHVQKRMGTRLRKVTKDKKLGGRGKLTQALINKLSVYYGLAIRRNIDSVENMKKAVMATYYHLCSTDDKPSHESCPPGPDSWCKWQKAKASGEKFNHPAPLHPDIQQHVEPIFLDLSRDELLERCLGGHTQNANESFNSTVWRLAPKHLHSGSKIIEMVSYIAAGLFNEGYTSILETMNSSNIIIGRQCKSYAEKLDEKRVIQGNRLSLLATKEARKARQQQLMEKNEFYEASEGQLYGAGIAD